MFLRCYGARKIKSQDFLDDIKSGKYNVLHVSSHGASVKEADKQLLQLEDEEGRPFWMSLETLGEWIRDSSVQMVYLDACETGVGPVRNPLADLSHIFLDKEKGAVVAMQFSVSVACANAFCQTFYSQLVEGEPIEFCLSKARTRIVHPVFGLDRIDWAIPVLNIGGKGVLRVGGEREARTPYKPLPSLGLFVGREEDLNKLTEYIVDPEVSVVSVDGFGGIGKSTTVNKLVSDIGCLFADVCWIDCRPKISHDEIIKEINDMLLYNGVGFSSDELAKYSPEGKNDRIAYALEEKDEDFVVVFDNFDSVSDDSVICGLVKRIGEVKRTKVLVTLRTPMSLTRKQSSFRLNKLEEDDALLLMRRLGEQFNIDRVKRAKDLILKNINARVDGHPKAIEVVIPSLKSKSVKTVLEELPQVLAGDIGPILEWSFNLLTAEEREFLFELSVYDGAVPLDAFKAVHIGSYPIPVTELVEKNLLAYDTVRELYNLHPLVREYAYDQLRRERRRKLHRLAAKYFLSEEVKDPVSAIYHMYKAEDWKHGMYATSKILDRLILRGSWTEAKSLCEQGLSASRKVKSLEDESYFLFNLARMFDRFGVPDEAMKLYKKSLDIDRRLEDKRGIAISLGQLATIEKNKGNYDEAQRLYKQILDIFQDLGDKMNESKTLHLLAMIHQDRGEYEEAVKLYEESHGIQRRLGDKRGVASSLGQLAILQTDVGNYEEAEKLHKQILDIFQDLGDKMSEAATLHNLAIIHQRRGEYEEAVRLYEQSLEIDRDLGDKMSEAATLHQLAMIEQAKGNYDEAEKIHKQSLKITRKLRDKSGIALTLGALGDLSEARNQLDRAKEYYEKALQLFCQLGDKPHTDFAKKLLNRIKNKIKQQK